MEVLNLRLFRALEKAFDHHVRVENHTIYRHVVYLPDWRRDGRPQAADIISGEYYCVNCPFCYDTRQRLYVNYEWAESDPQTGDTNLHLVHCFNEDCIGNRVRQKQLLHRVYPLGRSRFNPQVETTIPDQPPSVAPSPPSLPDGQIRPINTLAPSHPAADYLLQRGFDLGYLSDVWGVYYCEWSLTPAPPIVDRIVIPVYQLRPRVGWSPPETFLAGWQARFIGPCPAAEAKYLSCKGTRKSQMLYGLPDALGSAGPIVVVEGPTDVWRLRSHAVALFGKDMSVKQQQMLARYFPNRPIVLFLDRDARDNAVKLRKQLRSGSLGAGDHPIAIAELPPGRDDVGDCTTEEAWNQVHLALQQAVRAP